MNLPLGVIVVAGGSGQRMGSACPKQYLQIGGCSILELTLKTLIRLVPSAYWVVVLPAQDIEEQGEKLSSTFSPVQLNVVSGGSTRAHSVFNGLEALPPTVERVLVHDAVRPLISDALMSRLLTASGPSVLPVVPCVDSLRLLNTPGSIPVDRSSYVAVQTPQVFDAKLLRDAFNKIPESGRFAYTDDASLVQAVMGVSPTLVEGDPDNIKITTPKDMAIAQCLLQSIKE